MSPYYDHNQQADELGLALDTEDVELLREAEENPDALVTDTPNDQKLKTFSVICIIVNRMIGNHHPRTLSQVQILTVVVIYRKRDLQHPVNNSPCNWQRPHGADILGYRELDGFHGAMRIPRAWPEHTEIQAPRR
jgi:hypothetical protein